MEPVAQLSVSLENPNAHLKGQSASKVELFDVSKEPNTRSVEVNGRLMPGVLLTLSSPPMTVTRFKRSITPLGLVGCLLRSLPLPLPAVMSFLFLEPAVQQSWASAHLMAGRCLLVKSVNKGHLRTSLSLSFSLSLPPSARLPEVNWSIHALRPLGE